MHIIKGCPRDQWDNVQAIQHEPFVYIMNNGSHFAGQEEDDLSELLRMLSTHPLDATYEERGGFETVDPCEGVTNPEWTWGNDAPRWIDGPRLYACEGVVRFGGNFLTYSHGFSLDTNHAPTIAALREAIAGNRARADYRAQFATV
jgi:hypothetical protein